MAYVYEHWRPDLNEPFWVGKGSGGRAGLIKRRNRHHISIVAKLASIGLKVDVRIVADDLSDIDAFNVEVERMEFWRSQGIRLANQSVGGRGGMSGCIRSESSREKQSATTKGRKVSSEQAQAIRLRNQTPEMRALVSKVHTGRKRPIETGARISAGQKRSWSDPKTKARRLASIPTPTFTEQTRAKMRAAKTPEARAVIAEAVKKRWADPEHSRQRCEAMKKARAQRIHAHA